VSRQAIADDGLAGDGLADTWDAEADGDPEEPEMRVEQPVLAFPCCHITIHLLVENDVAEAVGRPLGRHARHAAPSQLFGSGEKGRSDAAIDSYERDMLAYAYRNRRPFRTQRIGKPSRITAVFPSLLKFVSEDTEVHLRASGAPDDRGRQVELDVSTCVTWFEESGRGVLHVTFSPAANFELNEYDLLKLVKLWEGGECITAPVAFRADGEELGTPWPQGIRDPNDPELACWTYNLLTALASWASRGMQTRLKLVSGTPPGASDRYSPMTEVFCVGTLDLLEEKGSVKELLASVTKLLERQHKYAEVADLLGDDERLAELQQKSKPLVREWQRLVAVGGLIQGLLDFDQIGVDELRDVYATVIPTEEQATPSLVGMDSLTAIHKGTLLSVAPSTERAQSWKTAVNPYLAIAHSVALYNEERMTQARQSALAAVRPAGDAMDASRAAADGGRASFYLSIAKARLWLRLANEQLEQFVPNVFVYPSERLIYEICHQTRALTGLRDDAKEQLELSRGLVEYREKKHGAVFAIIALVLGLIASVEGYFVKTKVWVAEPLLALVAVGLFPLMVYAAFYFWRRHH
jgi:hypothetical protein